jgi:hypothetical protein
MSKLEELRELPEDALRDALSAMRRPALQSLAKRCSLKARRQTRK